MKERESKFYYSIAVLLTVLFCVSFFSRPLKAEVSDKDKVSDPIRRFFPASFISNPMIGKIGSPIEVTRGDFFKTLNKKGVVEEKIEETKVVAEKIPEPVKNARSMEFQTSDISKKTFLPPDQTPPVAINPEAPSSAISMIESNRRGDKPTAKAYAKQFVRVMQNYIFEVREITALIGDALIEEKAIGADDWVGAEQGIDIELAKSRLEMGVPIKPSQDVAMQRIIPDPKKEVQVFYIISRSCSYCRIMTPDVERLYRVLKDDKRVSFKTLVIGQESQDWLKEFRNYTGLSMEVFNGEEFARALKVKFVPVLLVITPNGKRSYIKSGQQTFDSMYEFVRVAQGLPVEDSSVIQSIIKTPMGEGDKLLLAQAQGKNALQVRHFGEARPLPVSMPDSLKERVQVDKF